MNAGRRSRLTRAMHAKVREAKDRVLFERNLDKITTHFVEEGCKLDRMLKDGKVPTVEELTGQIMGELGYGKES